MAPVGAGPFYPDIESARPLPREDTRSPLSATGLSFWEGQARPAARQVDELLERPRGEGAT